MSPEQAAKDSRWLRLYQYQPGLFGIKSDIQSPRFFFSENGMTDPVAELNASIEAFSGSTKKYGTLELPAACTFPARKKILEQLLGRSFPQPACPDLDEWIDRIRADQAYLVFVGAYAGNAASIMGHSFLRLADSKRESQNREGIDLLAQSVGYLAKSDPSDMRPLYILKGLFGGYPGYFDIEPHYMKVGLYNNSESRDLFELRLKLTPDEGRLLTELIWEYTFNAEIPYFFIGKNCSYRVLTLLEIVRPDWELTSEFYFEVLPAETLRKVIDQSYSDGDIRFRASIKRRLALKVEAFTPAQKESFSLGSRSMTDLQALTDVDVLDALLDYWIFENYKAQAKLPDAQAALMEATYSQMQKASGKPSFKLSNQEIREKQNSKAPFEGHRPRWLQVGANLESNQLGYELQLRSGIHPIWSLDSAYEAISAIEYLGLDYRSNPELSSATYRVLGLRALTLENFSFDKPQASWGFHFELTNTCRFCDRPTDQLQVSGTYGLAFKTENFRAGLFADAYAFGTRNGDNTNSLIAPGVRALLQYKFGKAFFHAEISELFTQRNNSQTFDFQLGHNFTSDHVMKIQYLKNDFSEGAAALQFVSFY